MLFNFFNITISLIDFFNNITCIAKNSLFYILNWPLFCMFFIFFFNIFKTFFLKSLLRNTFFFTLISLGLFLNFVVFSKQSNLFFYAIFQINILPVAQTFWGIFGSDFITLSLFMLTLLFIFLVVFNTRLIEFYGKLLISELLIKLFLIQWGLLCAFSSLDLLNFFIFFEMTLIPIFLIIIQGGSRARKVRASYLISLYTLFGSIFMLFSIFYILTIYNTTNYLILYNTIISNFDQKILWFAIFFTCAVKIPVFPFHQWLSEAHTQAPTIGSVLLAALLLKLGIFGLLRFGLPLFPEGQTYFKYLIVILTICSFFYTNLTAVRQVDVKKIVAYSSVVHMNLIVLGILCISVESLDGAIYQMLAHGIVSGALFFCIGILYERFKSRFLWYYGGLAFIMPIYSFFFFIYILANISFPLTSNFIGEMLLFFGIFQDKFIIGVIATFSMFFGVLYNMWTYNRLVFGNIKLNYNNKALNSKSSLINKVNANIDLEKIDMYILITLLLFLILTGVYSSLILDYISLNSTGMELHSLTFFSFFTKAWKNVKDRVISVKISDKKLREQVVIFWPKIKVYFIWSFKITLFFIVVYFFFSLIMWIWVLLSPNNTIITKILLTKHFWATTLFNIYGPGWIWFYKILMFPYSLNDESFNICMNFYKLKPLQIEYDKCFAKYLEYGWVLEQLILYAVTNGYMANSDGIELLATLVHHREVLFEIWQDKPTATLFLELTGNTYRYNYHWPFTDPQCLTHLKSQIESVQNYNTFYEIEIIRILKLCHKIKTS